MSKDINQALEGWDYDPDEISVRIVRGADGRDKIQMRLDLGLLQMEFDGRPDGRRPEGFVSYLEYFRNRQETQDRENPDAAPFLLESDDCSLLLREGVQYYHRYISFWRLERYELCARDTNRNLKLFAFVREFARHGRDKLQFDQWRPYVTMMHARAVATPLLELNDPNAALGAIDAGIAAIRRFLTDYDQAEESANCAELAFLLRWRDDLAAKQPSSRLLPPPAPERDIRSELDRAIQEERFEEAARLRDQLRRMAPPPEPRGPADG